MDILVRHDHTQQDIKRSHLKGLEFRPGRYTSGSANLDDMIALNKAVILCATHVRKFNYKAARYRAHPDKKLQRVMGYCDICKDTGLSFLFLNEKDADEEQKKIEKYKRALEYGYLFTG